MQSRVVNKIQLNIFRSKYSEYIYLLSFVSYLSSKAGGRKILITKKQFWEIYAKLRKETNVTIIL